jgi:hypothetical protein
MESLTNRLLFGNMLVMFLILISLWTGRSLAAPGSVPSFAPVSNTFTYEGRLGTISGRYDFKFRLFADTTSSTPVVSTVRTFSNILVDSGEYTVALNFGSAAFTGEARFLEVRYRKHSTDSNAAYSLQARQPLLATPYAMSLRPGATISGAIANPGAMLYGINRSSGAGLAGESASGPGVSGVSTSWYGVYGKSTSESGVRGTSTWGAGAVGLSQYWNGVYGESTSGTGVWGTTKTARQGIYGTNQGSGDSYGVIGEVTSFPGAGVLGQNGGSGSGTAGRSASGPGVYGESSSGYAMVAAGHTQQARDKGGWVKAMAHIQVSNANGAQVAHCFNSQQPAPSSATVPCGISVYRVNAGVYNIDFGFRVRDRFAIVSPEFSGQVAATVDNTWSGTLPETQLHVQTFKSYAKDDSLLDTNFTIIVY